jgi:hypothetical protein
MGRSAGQMRTNALVAKLAAARHLNATDQIVSPNAFKPGIPGLGPMSVYAPQSGLGVGVSNLWNAGDPSQ